MSNKKKEDPRTTRTRKLLRQALIQLLPRKKFNSISVQDIAECATLNRATFYAHFKDKNALVNHCLGELFEETVKSRLPIHSEPNAHNIKLVILLVCEYFRVLFTEYRIQAGDPLEALAERQVKTHLHGLLAGWLRKSAPRGGKGAPDQELTATAASYAIYGTTMQWARGARTVTPEKLAQQVLPVMNALLKMEAA